MKIKHAWLLIPMCWLFITGMSRMPDEQRELNTVQLSYFIPFTRTNNELMTWDEYKPVNIYINDVLYPYVLPVVDLADTETTQKFHEVYTFDDVLNIELTLEDLNGNESVRSPVLKMDFTDPSAPIIICQ